MPTRAFCIRDAVQAIHTCFGMQTKHCHASLTHRMQLVGIDIDKNGIQRLECGKRFITDIEIVAFARLLGKSYEELLRGE